MTRWFKHVAVIAAWLGLGAPVVLAQPGYPATVGAARQIGPLQYIPEQPPPNLHPGPVSPLVAPAGPPPSLNLPADHTNAFPYEGFPPENRAYGSVGWMALRRSGLTRLPIVYGDDRNFGVSFLPGNDRIVITTADSGAVPTGRLPVLLGLNDVATDYNSGVRASVGYLFANEAIELSGFFQSDQTEFREIFSRPQVVTSQPDPFHPKPAGSQAVLPGTGFTLFVPFHTDRDVPAGFAGNLGIWRQADYVKVSYSGAVGNVELNYRRWDSGLSGMEWLMGIRYFYAQERVSILTIDDLYNVDVLGRPDARGVADYAAMTRTNHVGLQIGGEWSSPIPCDPLSWVWVTFLAKTSAGFNFVERSWRLTRGDGRTGFEIHKNNVTFGNVTEVGGFFDLHFLERLRFRCGYQFLLGVNFPDAASQVTFNLDQQGTTGIDNGCIYWHGTVFEFQFLF